MSFHILVLAGGSGTRLWPLSREALPKHLLPLGPAGETLLRATVDRVARLGARVHVVTAAAQAEGCAAVLEGSAADWTIIAEPEARGTGPALGLAVHQIAAHDPDALIASVHADHDVADAAGYRAALVASASWAQSTGGLATVGLTPTSAATGLGYIEVGEPRPAGALSAPPAGLDPAAVAAARALPAARAVRFVEKPPADQAQRFLEDGRHLWNLGLFAWTAPAFLAELRAADAVLDGALRQCAEARGAHDEARASGLYAGLAPVAVEPLLFERSQNLTVVRAAFAWSDLGSWSDLLDARRSGADADGNVVAGDAVVHDSSGCLVESRGGRTVAVVGAEGLVVVDTGDAVLVMPAAASQRLRGLVDRLRQSGSRLL